MATPQEDEAGGSGGAFDALDDDMEGGSGLMVSVRVLSVGGAPKEPIGQIPSMVMMKWSPALTKYRLPSLRPRTRRRTRRRTSSRSPPLTTRMSSEASPRRPSA